jgi:DNA-binding CsgD family transcriptional regulator
MAPPTQEVKRRRAAAAILTAGLVGAGNVGGGVARRWSVAHVERSATARRWQRDFDVVPSVKVARSNPPPKVGAHGEMDCRSFREALSILGERQGLGIVVSDARGTILFASPRARRLLGTTGVLPAEIMSATDDRVVRMSLDGRGAPVGIRVARLAGTARHALVTLEEDRPRATLAKGLIERFGLSARSIQLVQLTSRGLTNREIGKRLRLSEATVKTYLHVLFRELGVRNRAELVALADRVAQGATAMTTTEALAD